MGDLSMCRPGLLDFIGDLVVGVRKGAVSICRFRPAESNPLPYVMYNFSGDIFPFGCYITPTSGELSSTSELIRL